VLEAVRIGATSRQNGPESVLLLGSQTHGEQTPHRIVHQCSGVSGGGTRLGSSLSGNAIFFIKGK
jgi:hypothetical protein